MATLASCIKTDSERIEEMKSPVVVKSTGEDEFGDDMIVIVDAEGNVEVVVGGEFESLKPGDTLK